MCILFSYISKCLKPNEFKVILLNNRDEFFHRASKPAHFANENNIYGMDMTPGKEGGTWLGMSTLGKIGVLLNLDKNDHGFDQNKEGRGFLVPNFLNSDLNASKYANTLKPNDYNPFNLVLFEHNEKNLWNAKLLDAIDCKLKLIDSEFLSISNHCYSTPYVKTQVGHGMFKSIVNEYNSIDKKNELVKNLFEFAKYDAGKNFHDVLQQGGERAVEEMMREQIFINIPNYGTRTHTLILVDNQNRVTFSEKTMEYPIAESKPKWEENSFEFDLKL